MIKIAIKKTLAFFNIFSHALTKEELYEWLFLPGGRVERDFFEESLKDFRSYDGFFALTEKSVQTRQKRVKLVEKKLKIALRAARKLRYLPFIKAVFVCNTLAFGTVNKNSDIDFFVIAQKDRIWTARFFANLVLKLFRLRTNAKRHSNRICLSFFAGSQSLDLKGVKIASDDIYLIYWLASLLPVYDPNGFYEKIIESNKWAKYYLPNLPADFYIHPDKKVRNNLFSKRIKRFGQKILKNRLGLFWENKFKKIQVSRLARLGILRLADGKNVIIDDNLIKLHDQDRRREFLDQWKYIVNNYE